MIAALVREPFSLAPSEIERLTPAAIYAIYGHDVDEHGKLVPPRSERDRIREVIERQQIEARVPAAQRASEQESLLVMMESTDAN